MSAPTNGRAAIVLAAGLSRRMGEANKLLLPYKGAPLAAHAVRAACGSSAARVVLVTGRDPGLRALHHDAKLTCVENPSPARGLSSSLIAGLEEIEGATVCAVLLADMPDVTSALLDRLFGAWRASAYALTPACEGEWGHPVLLGRQAMRDARGLAGDTGMRGLLRARADVIVMETGDPGVLRDFDTPGDFEAASAD